VDSLETSLAENLLDGLLGSSTTNNSSSSSTLQKRKKARSVANLHSSLVALRNAPMSLQHSRKAKQEALAPLLSSFNSERAAGKKRVLNLKSIAKPSVEDIFEYASMTDPATDSLEVW
jgi:hypothetical protein